MSPCRDATSGEIIRKKSSSERSQPSHCVSPAYGCAVRLIPFCCSGPPRDGDHPLLCSPCQRITAEKKSLPVPRSSAPRPVPLFQHQRAAGGAGLCPGVWGSPCPSCRSAQQHPAVPGGSARPTAPPAGKARPLSSSSFPTLRPRRYRSRPAAGSPPARLCAPLPLSLLSASCVAAPRSRDPPGDPALKALFRPC